MSYETKRSNENSAIASKPYVGPVPSREQQEAIRSLRIDNKNIVVKGIPGAGKTTLILEIARAFPRISILALTFSASLKDEMRSKKQDMGINNLTVHSYHSFVKNHYDQPDAHTDVGLITLIRNNVQPHTRCLFKMILLDEEQDKTFTLHQLTLKIIHDHFLFPFKKRQTAQQKDPLGHKENNTDSKQSNHTIVSTIPFDQQLILCVLGDPHQNIYAYKGSDVRYLTMAPSVLGHVSTRPWTFVTLQTSFRLTKPMAQFINRHVFHGEPRLIAVKDGPPVEYYRCCARNSAMDIVHSLLWKDRIHPNDIFVFAPSTGPRTLSSQINNFLAANGNFTFISNEESPPDSSRLMSNKTSFLTHWKGKGLERKVSVVLNFDTSVLRWDPDEEQCPAPLFVALTRGSERLIVIQDHRNDPLPFMNMEQVDVQEWEDGTNLNCSCPKYTKPTLFANTQAIHDDNAFSSENEFIHTTDPTNDGLSTQKRKRKRKHSNSYPQGDKNTHNSEEEGEEEDKQEQKDETTTTTLIRHCTKPDATFAIPQLLRHRQVMELIRLARHVDVVWSKQQPSTSIVEPDWCTPTITIPSLVCSGLHVVEDVRALNEIAIPSIFEMVSFFFVPSTCVCTNKQVITGQCSILSNLFQAYKSSRLDPRMAHDDRIRPLFRKLLLQKTNATSSDTRLTVSDILFLSCAWNAHRSGHLHRFMQLKKFDWIHEEDVDAIRLLLEPHLPSKEGLLFNHIVSTRLEIPCPSFADKQEQPGKKMWIELEGTFDVVDVPNKTVFQFLWNSEITLEHHVRIECMMWMMKHATTACSPSIMGKDNTGNPAQSWNTFRYKIVNILDGKTCEISIRKDVNAIEFDSLIRELVHMKWAKRSTLTDSEFLQQSSIQL